MKTFLIVFTNYREVSLGDYIYSLDNPSFKISGTCGLNVDGDIVHKYNLRRECKGSIELSKIKACIANTDNSSGTIIISSTVIPKTYKQLINYCKTGYWIKFNRLPINKYRDYLIVNYLTPIDDINDFLQKHDIIHLVTIINPTDNFVQAISSL